jgi:hypothetical protein
MAAKTFPKKAVGILPANAVLLTFLCRPGVQAGNYGGRLQKINQEILTAKK